MYAVVNLAQQAQQAQQGLRPTSVCALLSLIGPLSSLRSLLRHSPAGKALYALYGNDFGGKAQGNFGCQ